MGKVYIGISGWRYAPWRGVFYPPGLAQARELEFASPALPSIEINGSFYALQRPHSYAAWYAATPPGFVFSHKGNRYLTHILRLRDVETPLANVFASGVFNLREKLRPFLWQFPPPASATTPTWSSDFSVCCRTTQGGRWNWRAAATTACAGAAHATSTRYAR